MSCALPYATRASLDPNDLNARVSPHISSEMPAAEPMEFVDFPRGAIKMDAGWASIDLSMTTPQGFLALSKYLSKAAEWTAVTVPAVPARRAGRRAAPRGASHELFRDSSIQNHKTVDRIAFNKPVLAPVAFVRFCMRYQEDCNVTLAGVDLEPVVLTNDRWDELVKVNEQVNRAIKPEENAGGVMTEEWIVSPRRGDCNDYAVTKRHELLARGWPSHSLMLAEVVVASGEHHLILVVRTHDDDFVLDNLSSVVRPVSQIGYEWVRAQRLENPKLWATINVARADRVAMSSR